jgi:hypothetical protein
VHKTSGVIIFFFHSKNKGNMYSELKPPAYQQTVSMDANYFLNANIQIESKLVCEWGEMYGRNVGILPKLSDYSLRS